VKKKKILFIISDDLFVRNYIDTGVYKFLEKIFNICLIANEKINSKEKIKKIKSFKGFYKISEKEVNDIANVTNQQIWKKINKSSTIKLKKKLYFSLTNFMKVNYIIKILIS
jgi:predicted transcriptional regulator